MSDNPMGLSEDTLLFGRIAEENGLLTRDQLSDALMKQMQNPSKPIGKILIEEGILDQHRVMWVLQRQKVERQKPPSASAAGTGQQPAATATQAAPAAVAASPVAAATVALSPAAIAEATAQMELADSAPGAAVGLEVAPPLSLDALSGSSAAPIAQSATSTAQIPTAQSSAVPTAQPSAVPTAQSSAVPTAQPSPSPATAAPVSAAPVAQATAAQTPATQTPATQAPPVQQPAKVEPVQAKPVAQNPAPAAAPPETSPSQSAVATDKPLAVLPTRPVAAAPGPAEASLHKWIQMAQAQGASDLHFHSGTTAKIRIHGDLKEVPGQEISTQMVEAMLGEILTDQNKEALRDLGQVDFAYTVPGVARLRCNAYRQQRGTDVAFRIVPPKPPSLSELGLPDTLQRFGQYHQGMVLFTGPTGCGKTSTLAALLDLVNQAKADHILTVEDPIEFIHESKVCVVNQRQVNHHTESFARALRAALREDPDVIVIGELRDLETISLALTAAETGHLVLATMHTMNAIATINRVIGAFPPDEQSQVRTMVSESLRAVVSQRLVKKADGSGRVPALEILVNNTAIANLIRDQKTFQIPGMLQMGKSEGMCELDASLSNLVKAGTITREEALAACDNPKGFK